MRIHKSIFRYLSLTNLKIFLFFNPFTFVQILTNKQILFIFQTLRKQTKFPWSLRGYKASIIVK